MISSQLRANAREALKGKWGKAALMVLCFFIILFALNLIILWVPGIGAICYMIISIPLSYGFLASFIKLKRDEEVGYIDFISLGFSSFAKTWAIIGNMILKLVVPFIVAIVFIVIFMFSVSGSIVNMVHYSTYYSVGSTAAFGGLAIIGFIGYIVSLIYLAIKSYYYVLSYYILYDNPDMTGKEIVEKSKELMTGNRWSFFWLGLTFIGWAILSIFTLYIGWLWLSPYIMVTFICFYDSLIGKDNVAKTVTAPKEEDSNPISE